MILRIPALVFVFALAACAPGAGVERLSAGSTVDIASAATQLSVQRAAGGIIRPLVHSPALQAVAQAQADDLRDAERLGQVGASGTPLAARLRRAGYTACAATESTASGTSNIRNTIARWMGDRGERANLLNPQVTQFGFASAGETWVLVLARPC